MKQNPYQAIQYLFRKQIATLLSRDKPSTDNDQWQKLVPDPAHRKKLMLRLCTPTPNGRWEWKPELVDAEILRKRVPCAEQIGLIDLFEKSRSRRYCQFKYLAPANRRGLIHPSRPH